MKRNHQYDAVIICAGPNGLSAAITLARAGYSVLIMEAKEAVGGGCRSARLTLPGFIHDPCATIHPLGVASPLFQSIPLSEYGLEWIYPPASLVHPLDDGTAVVLERSVVKTSNNLGQDGTAYKQLIGPFVANWKKLIYAILGPLRFPPRHPLILARFGFYAIRSAKSLALSQFNGVRGRALFAGLAGHSIQSLDNAVTAAFGLVLGTSGHAVGWPIARGGSQSISDALADYFRKLGGKIVTRSPVDAFDDIPSANVVLFDVTPHQLINIVGDRLPSGYRNKLERFRYGPGVFKIDYALDDGIPWKAAECTRAATAHLGGTLEEIVNAEDAVSRGEHPQKPFVILAQQSLFDPTRAPNGKQTVWAYCHVPHGSNIDITDTGLGPDERFAQGFAIGCLRSVQTPKARSNTNYIGEYQRRVQDWRQLFHGL
jgi:phytoene dehydrogenase-like protein